MNGYLNLMPLLLALAALVTACQSDPVPPLPGISEKEIQEEPKDTIPWQEIVSVPDIADLDAYNHRYRQYTYKVKRDKELLRQGLGANRIDMDSVSRYFLATMRDSMFHYWYGTPWAFEGYTAKPRNGKIACGYFISTPLKQLGLNVNRYKLAQQAAEPIMKSVCVGESFFRTHSLDSLRQYLDTQPPDALYVIGLSSHVGYILREGGLNYMVHSDYFHPVRVVKKALPRCEAINTPGIYVLGELSHNEVFLRKWLEGKRVEVLKE